MINSWKDIPADKMQAMVKVGKQYPDRGNEFDAEIARILGITEEAVPAAIEQMKQSFVSDMSEAFAPLASWYMDAATILADRMSAFVSTLPPWMQEQLAKQS